MATKKYFTKDPSVPPIVSQHMAKIGSIGGALSAHTRWNTPLPAGIVPKEKKAKTKKRKRKAVAV